MLVLIGFFSILLPKSEKVSNFFNEHIEKCSRYKNLLDLFVDTKRDTEQYLILSQITKSFVDTKSSISGTKLATVSPNSELA